MSFIEKLRPELREHLISPSPLGANTTMLHHPLLIVTMPLESYPLEMIERLNTQYEVIKQSADEYRAAKNWTSFVFRHERPYRLDAFMTAEIEGSLREYPDLFWPLVGHMWTDSENIWQNFDDWKDLWESGVDQRHLVMDEDEREHLSSLPEYIDIWRGFAHRSSMLGLSWTTEPKKAKWFANRFKRKDNKPQIVHGRVLKRDVCAFFAGRNENEIVAIPDDVEILDIQEC